MHGVLIIDDLLYVAENLLLLASIHVFVISVGDILYSFDLNQEIWASSISPSYLPLSIYMMMHLITGFKSKN